MAPPAQRAGQVKVAACHTYGIPGKEGWHDPIRDII